MATFSCYLMGGESLLVQCGEMILGRGHTVQGVISTSRDIVRWAETHGIPVISGGKGLSERIEGGFDWFFSIANLAIIPDEILVMAKEGAINFHDGPLPRYAGLNAPNWALLHREPRHGVTWHRIQGGVDEGNILAQRHFDVAPLATALEINRSCYEAAIESFPEVLEKLETADAEGESQDLAQRTYFGLHDRPEALALIDWSKDAEDVVALVRALDYGESYANPLHLAKLVLPSGEVRLVLEAEVAHGNGEPGKVLEAKPEGALVAARTGAVRILGLRDQDGGPVCPSSLSVGESLSNPSGAERARLTEKNAALCKADTFWRGRLRSLDEIELPQLELADGAPQPMTLPYDAGGLTGTRWVAGVGAWLSRLGGKARFHVAFQGDAQREAVGPDAHLYASAVPLLIDASGTVGAAGALLDKELSRVGKRRVYARDLIARDPEVHPLRAQVVLAPGAEGPVPGAALTLTESALHYDAGRLPQAKAENLALRLGVVLAAAKDDDARIAELPLLTAAERRQLLFEWNRTSAGYEPCTMHALFEAQVDRTPDAIAIAYEGMRITYKALDARANQVAHYLRGAGVKSDDIVGLYCYRHIDLVVGALGILKAGGAYLPLDPDYPTDRIAFMLEDSKARYVITHAEARKGFSSEAEVIAIDQNKHVREAPTERLGETSKPGNLAYVIYTSGSTGRPKGVMVEHRNAANFFVGMDARIEDSHLGMAPDGRSWLAVTSLSFDISVLELFWTLTRGFKVVLHRDRERQVGGENVDPTLAARPMAFGLMYWGNDDGQGPRKYEVLLEGAKYADKNGFNCVWTPERHFHAFGGPYPNPAVTGAAVAAVTKSLEVRAGSCVAPLHHPVRIAEEWAVVDNLTNGRTGIGFASGWMPEDFVIKPENTPPRNKPAMFETIELVRKLWRGEEVAFPKADGEMHAVVSQPRPVSEELQCWVTTAGNPDTYRNAGRLGLNVLTHLLGQSLDEVSEKIAIYREARREAGFDPATGKVTLMLHTYLAESREISREVAREPMKNYLRSAAGLIKQYAWAFPAFKKPEGVSSPFELDLRSLNDEEMDAILEFAFMRYFEDSGLFGTVEDAVKRVNQCKGIGVDEIACLVDYGVPTPKVLESLTHVAEVIKRTNRSPSLVPEGDFSLAGLLADEQVTHLQCTPSMARMMTMDDRVRSRLRGLKQLMVGGEALPGALVQELRKLTDARIENMYGPTETTIWSSTQTAAPSSGITPIGTPIANTQLYVLDGHRQPVPVGVPGELYIGGDGVTRGYLHRPELTAERFVDDPFRGGGARMYRTGDLVRWREDGVVDFIGRVDHQVKLRGYRIELGEIESRLNDLDAVREAVVIVREDVAGDKRLVAYLTAKAEIEEAALRRHLGAGMPEYMVPAYFVVLDALPLTPNKKIDRKKLPRPEEVQRKQTTEYVAPESAIEEKIASVWRSVLGVKRVGAKDNFFELGGHSLLAVQAHRELKATLGVNLAITDIFRFPTLGALAAFVGDQGGEGGNEQLSKAAERAAKRRQLRRRR